jgi:hypothetical protein
VFSVTCKEGWLTDGQGGAVHHVENPHDFYRWKDAHTLTVARSEISSINVAISNDPEYKERSPYRKVLKCFGDEMFLVKCVDDGIEVYCFDKDYPLAKECKSYRRERDRRAEERTVDRKRRAERAAQC